jgi:uncharacterized protein YpuA (DUF1002 family)
MTFVEFKKSLLDAELTIPKFCNLIKISDKNLQSYKNKEAIPNSIATIILCFIEMKKNNIDFSKIIDELNLELKTKKGSGFANKKTPTEEKTNKQ